MSSLIYAMYHVYMNYIMKTINHYHYLGRLDFFNVASKNVFYKVHLHSTYVLIKVTIDLWYHGVLILCQSVVSNTFLRNIFLVKHFLISIIQRVPPP